MNYGSDFRLKIGNGSKGINATSKVFVDNEQATYGVNMWYQDKLLKVRPGLNVMESMVDTDGNTYSGTPIIVSDYVLLKERKDKATGSVGESDYGYYVLFHEYNAKSLNKILAVTVSKSVNTTTLVGTTNVFDGTFAVLGRRTISFDGVGGNTGKTFTADNVMFVGGGNIYEIKKGTNDTFKFQPITPYVPLVYINKNPDGTNAQHVEGFNLLSPYWRERFTSDGTSSEYKTSQIALAMVNEMFVTWDTVVSNESKHFEWTIPRGMGSLPTTHSNRVLVGTVYVAVQVTYATGVFKFVSYPTAEIEEGEVESEYKPARISLETNNIEIKASKFTDNYNTDVITYCTCSAWFGGNVQGLESGTRLFLSGNVKTPSTVYWSGLNNPYYFAEDANNNVGADDDRVIAFGRQFDNLVIFKTLSIYVMQYNYSDELLGGTGSEYFITFPIHERLGCLSKGSVQLINNNLVWLGSDLKIYTLRYTQRTNERNARPISKNIEALISGIPQVIPPTLIDYGAPLNLCSSLDYKGYYILISGNKAWAWNYDDTPYVDYSDTEKAQNLLAWYYWEFPVKVFSTSGKYLFTGDLSASHENSMALCFDLDLTYDRIVDSTLEKDFSPISKLWRTKLYDLDYPEKKKIVNDLWISFSSDTEEIVNISIITEKGSDNTIYPIYPAKTADDITREYHLKPRVKNVSSAGIEFSANGIKKLDYAGAVAKFETIGDVK